MTGIIILAAGESRRLGKPKQSLLFNGKTLLQLTVANSIKSGCCPVIVVLGAHAENILPEITVENINVVYNHNWKEGMASSIRIGIVQLQKNPDVNSVIIMLCDQPFADAELLQKMLYHFKINKKNIIACTYNNTIGVPVLFGQGYFNELLTLTGHEGAKKLLTVHKNDIHTLSFPLGSIDIDTMENYNDLQHLDKFI